MKLTSIIFVILALLIGVAPQFTDCESQGRSLTLENGRQIPMKCHWTARGEIALAAPLLVVGSIMGFNKRKETRRNLGLIGIALGAFIILLPTYLIGVCANPDMVCNSFMRPFLILTGSLVIAAGLAAVILPLKESDTAA